MKEDNGRIVRLLPIAAGSIAGTLLMLNRLLTPALTDSQARSDAVGVVLTAVLILTGLLWQQVQPRKPDSTVLSGTEGFELLPTLPDALKTELAWASHLLLTNTVTRSIVVYYRGQVLLRRGILAPIATVTPGAILDRVLAKQKAIYLVDTKVYPGRIEFNYLPVNTQGIICQPLGTDGVMILGANAPRSYTKQDEAWIEGIADKLANSLATRSAIDGNLINPNDKI
ncbi:cofactor assembly of complex C subunit B [Chamaesiphon sp. OTE_20_metabat_361]|uniref:cofactor assembly of complex C subunit B n=1 Tax=Chamaesiphon sp. OTE_20_metabat_361 TaxID=2964689 RepID=UPI00286BC275|nr:cofactor assembly of complex C subunit B [Chamaesiphon sp. OTE_20_metabat_361]